MAGEMWKLRVPGFRSSAQAVEYKSMMKVLEALTDEELEDKSLLRGLRLMRVARQSEQPVRFVNQVLSRFDQTAMLHMWLHRQHDEGRALPTTMEEAHERMAADPAVRRYSAGMASSKVIQRRINRRGSL
ncbi:hypothetical protein CTAYLR_005291 [Chrysophaeum taylorii]|uniref:Signal recognition particle SRP54 subunit M-domain domain-containing protein n=1 Tax=Chrysophaeum taylorii TaxID=2483200 RepID=A0AAD7UJ89_9STRA|nr:hypothetical protein CTAYLR_005291 [Chrysophaeum taylorii]